MIDYLFNAFIDSSTPFNPTASFYFLIISHIPLSHQQLYTRSTSHSIYPAPRNPLLPHRLSPPDPSALHIPRNPLTAAPELQTKQASKHMYNRSISQNSRPFLMHRNIQICNPFAPAGECRSMPSALGSTPVVEQKEKRRPSLHFIESSFGPPVLSFVDRLIYPFIRHGNFTISTSGPSAPAL